MLINKADTRKTRFQLTSSTWHQMLSPFLLTQFLMVKPYSEMSGHVDASKHVYARDPNDSTKFDFLAR